MNGSKTIYLDRLDITGPIDLNTPICVIREICLSHLIKFEEKWSNSEYLNNVINTIYESPREKITEDYEEDRKSLKIICGYVNSEDRGWRQKPLLEAFHFLQSFKRIQNDSSKRIQKNTKRFIQNDSSKRIQNDILEYPIGPQTNSYPKSLNACILYCICKEFNIQINNNTSLEEMYELIKLHKNLENPQVIYQIKNSIYDLIKYNECQLSDLINILSHISPNKIREINTNYLPLEDVGERDTYTIEQYSELADIIRNNEIRTRAKNHLEAIVMAAVHYKIDISETQNPYLEYLEIQKNPYFPSDKDLCKRFKETDKHPDSFQNPFLSEMFNPLLPASMYSNANLYKLCDGEGINYQYDYFPEALHSLLQASCYINNFYHGKQGNIINDENTFCEELDELHYDEVVIYGTRWPESFIFYTYGELREVFQNYKRFNDPQNSDFFEEIAIDKLVLLTQKPQRLSETDEMFEERIALGEEIERVKLYTQNKNKDIRTFLEKYENMLEEEHSYVQKILNMILESAMYMRAWDGESSYPLDSESTNFDNEEQIIVDHRVTQSIIRLETELEKYLGKTIIDLPLMQYHKDSKTFIASTDESEGLTIADRINIVKGGENGDFTSCIRMSSNKLCASAYYYMRLIGMVMPFDINDVAYIT